QKVRVVRRDHRYSGGGGEIEHESVELRLNAARVVRLHLEIVAIGEGVRVPESDALCLLDPSLQKMRGDLAGDACGGDDEPLGVAREQLAIHAGLRVEALGVGERRKLYEVAIAHGIAGEEDEVIVRFSACARAGTLTTIAWRDVCFHADDRLDASLLRFFLEVPRAVEIAVVRDRKRRLFE